MIASGNHTWQARNSYYFKRDYGNIIYKCVIFHCLAAVRFLKISLVSAAGFWEDAAEKATVQPKDSYSIELHAFVASRMRLYSPEVRDRAMRRLCAGADSALSASVTTLDPIQDDLLLTKMAANVDFSDIAPDLHRNLIARSPKGFFGVCLPTRSKSKDSDGTIMQRRAASQKIRRPTPCLITGW